MKAQQTRETVAITWVAGGVALFVALALPIGFFAVGLRGIDTLISAKAAVRAEKVSQIVAAMPDTWKIADHRLDASLHNNPAHDEGEQSVVRDLQNNVIYTFGSAPGRMALSETRELYDSGEVAGYVDVHYPLVILVRATGWIAVLSCLLGGGVFVVFRQQPLRALDRALRTITEEQQRAEERLLFMAHHDSLTGLPNRAMLKERLEQAILYAQRYNRLVTVAFMDVDNFKLINDSLGHNAGDEIIKTVADRMRNCLRASDTVVRLGGDEFVIVLFDQPRRTEAITPLLQKIRETVAQTIYIGDQKLQVTCSVGLATYPSDGTDVDTLLKNADAAMYRAKESGRDNYQFYAPEMNAKVQKKLALQEALRKAIAGSEFMLLYQPQVDLRSGKIFGVEALIRWQHPEKGMVSPAEFIPLAETSGLIVSIGDWVLRTACRQNKAWQDAGMPPITMSVNVSARQFKEKSLVGRVAYALQESGLEARYLELELTESLIMQDMQQAIATMRELQAMGVRLAIDDFGTGYSSLSALKSFPIVRLKIDQSFVRDLSDDEDDKAIVTAVISLGHKLNLKVIAEGVETDHQLTFLRDNDCDEMQGYRFSKPVLADAIAALLRMPMPAMAIINAALATEL